MIKKYFFKNLKSEKAFTLIELLVVIAIIGILSSVVVVSVNAAREKSKIASIKSTLKELYNQAAINQVTAGSFINSTPLSGSFINSVPSFYDSTCTGLKEDGTPGDSTTGNLAQIAKPLIDQGVIVKCRSLHGDYLGMSVFMGDNYNRFSAVALIYDAGELKAWAVDENGVVKFETSDLTSANLPGGDLKTWAEARSACANIGGRLPTIEELMALGYAWYSGSGDTTFLPFGFATDNYWSSVRIPKNLSKGYIFRFSSSWPTPADGSIGVPMAKARCVK